MIKKEIEKIIKEITGKDAVVSEAPLGFGDYASNVAIKERLDPQDLADKLQKAGAGLFSKVENKNGFINFFLKQEFLQKQVSEVLKQADDFGKVDIGKGRRLQVEFVSANPTGPLTLGNARGGPFGDTLANVLFFAGYKVKKAYYVNDLGNQILALGNSVLKNQDAVYKGEYIDELHKTIKEKNPEKAGKKAAEIILDGYIVKTLKKAGIIYDLWYCESKLTKWADKALKILEDKGFVCDRENARWFKATKFGDERDRVLIKSNNEKTYLAGDLGLHLCKFAKDKFDKVINIWGADHYGDVKGLLAGVEAMGYKGKLEILLCQFVTLLKDGQAVKMSKRQGNIITLSEVLDEVGVDALRFFFLQRTANTHLNFDLDLAKEQSQKNPVYYVQYAHARIASILRKIKSDRVAFKSDSVAFKQPSELALIKQIIKLPEVVAETAVDYQTQRLPEYALDLATAFHRFYTDCRVIDESNKNLTVSRLALTKATGIALKNTLSLMGIKAPNKM